MNSFTLENRFVWIDWLKAFGIILVVVAHTPGIPNKLVIWISAFHMPLFFLISGFLLSEKNLRNRLSQFLKKPLGKTLIAYAIFGVIGTAFFGLVSQFSRASHQDLGHALQNRALSLVYGSGSINSHIQLFPVVLWFFPALIVASLLVYGFNRLTTTCSRILITLAIIAGAALLKGKSLPWEFETALAAAPIMLLGNALRRNPKTLIVHFPASNVWAVINLVLGSWLAMKNGQTSFMASQFGNPFVYVSACAMLLYGSCSLAMKMPQLHAVTLVSNATILIFPMHTIIFWIIDSGIKRIPNASDCLIDYSLAYALTKSAITIAILCIIFPLFARIFRAAPTASALNG